MIIWVDVNALKFALTDWNAALDGTRKVQPWHELRVSIRPTAETAERNEVVPRLASRARPDNARVSSTGDGYQVIRHLPSTKYLLMEYEPD